MKDKSNLKIIPAPDPRLIPKYLVEQVKERDWQIDQFYTYQLKAQSDKANILLTIVDERHFIVGFVWLTLDGFSQVCFVNTVSIDKKHQGQRSLLKKIEKYIKELTKKLGFSKIIIVTKRTKVLQRYGFAESRNKILEMKA